MSVDLSALTLRLVHPTAPVLLTKSGPLGTLIRSFGRDLRRDTKLSRGFNVQASRSSNPFKV